ncbi:hypothetical protein BYT27DRAFT_7180391 [Phlegmacium glaucopus]|nr:hypothetical protein BYT27DRAFT_7180391 [Phlegmacium glaucopus]
MCRRNLRHTSLPLWILATRYVIVFLIHGSTSVFPKVLFLGIAIVFCPPPSRIQPIAVDEPEDVVEEEDDTISRPQARFERLCNQILDAAMYPRKQKKQVCNKGLCPAIPIRAI